MFKYVYDAPTYVFPERGFSVSVTSLHGWSVKIDGEAFKNVYGGSQEYDCFEEDKALELAKRIIDLVQSESEVDLDALHKDVMGWED